MPHLAKNVVVLNEWLRRNQLARVSFLAKINPAAVEILKIALVQPPVLTVDTADKYADLFINICEVQVGRVLLQTQQERILNPIRYWSCLFNSAERKSDITQRERVATVWTLFFDDPTSRVANLRFIPIMAHPRRD